MFARADRAVVLDLRMRHDVCHIWHVTSGRGQKRHRWHRCGSGYGTGGTHQRRSPVDYESLDIGCPRVPIPDPSHFLSPLFHQILVLGYPEFLPVDDTSPLGARPGGKR
ncbi:hypothetical protein NP493_428g01033 [Ridgeia piscesae]|uniref:Uncharacterized protein n=1 Tax=Ridgeia piscesae TaxID=27915 RepID=A0AAD9L0Z2_RIDPI|nr:hypothetical protein NP493_428g01033 [Ridgeia piscesae]